MKNLFRKIWDIKISGINLPIYLIVCIILVLAILTNKLPNHMVGAIMFLMILGNLLNLLGNKIPIIKSYLGGGAVFCIFVSSALASFSILPESTIEMTNKFMDTSGAGFLDFYIAALIAGSILGMDRKLLMKASIRFLPVSFLAMGCAILMVGLVGMISGYGFNEGIMYIALPMMSGGMGGGIIPISNIYANALGIPQADVLSKIVPASVLGNVFAIITAALLAKTLGETKLSGHGQLLKEETTKEEKKEESKIDYTKLGVGIIVAVSFYVLGNLVNYLIPQIHAYAFMIILIVVFKIANILPQFYQESAVQWSSFIMKNFTAALLVGIGISIDLNALISALTPTYILICLTSILTVAFFSGLFGRIVGFYSLESSITAGLCTNSMGGTGNIAVLSASNRMELIPFAQMATRIGGALILILASFLVHLL